MCVHFMKVMIVYHRPRMYEPLQRISQIVVVFCCLLKHFETSLTNSVALDQTAPIGAV